MIPSPSIALLLHVRVFLLLLVRLHACTSQTLTPPSGAPAKEKTFVGKTNLAGVPDDRYNSSAGTRMRCVVVLRCAGTSFRVNITPLTKSDLYHRVVVVANRRRVQQCQAAAAALLCVMGRREAGVLVVMRRVHLRCAVTRGLVCATKPPSTPRGHAHPTPPIPYDITRK